MLSFTSPREIAQAHPQIPLHRETPQILLAEVSLQAKERQENYTYRSALSTCVCHCTSL